MALSRAATVIAVRGEAADFEVLLIKRATTVSLPGFWTFPGGREETSDVELAMRIGLLEHPDHQHVSEPLRHLAITAWREFREEVGATVTPSPTEVGDLLIPLSHWITPAVMKRRYNTLYYLTDVPIGDFTLDTNEVEEARWWKPEDYLSAIQAAEIPATPPVIRTMIDLELCPDTTAAIAWARSARLLAVEPVLRAGNPAHVFFPGHPEHPSTGESIGAPSTLRSTSGRWEW
jgi:8-oxo-dGTP pyrophosphatase MutT (NUDIX family)